MVLPTQPYNVGDTSKCRVQLCMDMEYDMHNNVKFIEDKRLARKEKLKLDKGKYPVKASIVQSLP